MDIRYIADSLIARGEIPPNRRGALNEASEDDYYKHNTPAQTDVATKFSIVAVVWFCFVAVGLLAHLA